ncbi:hypothetical protein [Methylobacterium sp. J-092]|uniref:hypothetical protein n=1 Tax=Methylobacterium sp. J-092 TaxID=2836667 RepID=UPI001FB8AE0C|nr:hypothetical protein [Methylobacterium sp. J-092]MCJ2009210.1 hypothetical protein [Methylobacterium sp. J-092]
MVLDKEDHRDLLLEMVNGARIPGSMAEIVADLKKALIEAAVTEPKPPAGKPPGNKA